VTAAGAVAAIVVGWLVAQKPYILPPDLTLDQAKASHATLSAVVIGVAAGMVILAPSLWFLYRLVLQGRLDQEYEPLDQRFHP
jgi:cytochrome bd ubiquinol oxidase subunit II